MQEVCQNMSFNGDIVENVIECPFNVVSHVVIRITKTHGVRTYDELWVNT
jgi:hypothetical protein